MKVRVIAERELRRLMKLDEALIETIEKAFMELARGGVEMPPILSLRVPPHHGEVDVKTAFVPGIPHIAVKISPGFFDNPSLGLSSLNGLMVMLDAKTGLLSALLLDNGYLTDIRTAAAGAVAAKALSRPDSQIVTVLGTGAQAKLQVEALSVVRTLKEIRVWGRKRDRAENLAKSLEAELAITTTAVMDAASAVKGADIVITTTPSENPILFLKWLEPGQHVTAVGSDADYKNELDPAIVAVAQPYVPDRLSQCVRLGELRAAQLARAVGEDQVFPELGQVLLNGSLGRNRDDSITVADLTGTGIQDTAIAAVALTRAQSADAGFLLDVN